MNAPTPAGTAAHDALAEVCRNQSLQLDAAREEIAANGTEIARLRAEIAGKDKTIAEQRALLAQHRLGTADEATEPEGDREDAE